MDEVELGGDCIDDESRDELEEEREAGSIWWRVDLVLEVVIVVSCALSKTGNEDDDEMAGVVADPGDDAAEE